MSELVSLGAIQAVQHCNTVRSLITGTEDSLQDIKQYLDTCIDVLPDDSDVPKHELLPMLKDILDSLEKARYRCDAANEWLLAIAREGEE